MMTLKTEHSSKIAGRGTPNPREMELTKLPTDVREGMEKIALSIFTDMTNSGASLQQTLMAIYLSGIQNTIAAIKDAQSEAFKEVRKSK